LAWKGGGWRVGARRRAGTEKWKNGRDKRIIKMDE